MIVPVNKSYISSFKCKQMQSLLCLMFMSIIHNNTHTKAFITYIGGSCIACLSSLSFKSDILQRDYSSSKNAFAKALDVYISTYHEADFTNYSRNVLY